MKINPSLMSMRHLPDAIRRYNNATYQYGESKFSMALAVVMSIILAVIIFLIGVTTCHAQVCPAKIGTASWYSVNSCKKEGTSGIMANGRKLYDEKFTAASWDYKLGTKVRVTNLDNEKSVVVVISDRGPARRLYRQGRIVDLSKAAFKSIGLLREGIIKVRVEKI